MTWDKEKMKAYQDEYRKNHREYFSNYAKQYRKTHSKERSDYYIDWYTKNGRSRACDYVDKIKEWEKRNPDKVKIKYQIQNAYKEGKITAPDNCSKCGRKAKIQAHHFNYDHWRNFIWLCASCHRKEHIKLRKEVEI
jgi:hypothetical protein